jgi:hypothetical protein
MAYFASHAPTFQLFVVNGVRWHHGQKPSDVTNQYSGIDVP